MIIDGYEILNWGAWQHLYFSMDTEVLFIQILLCNGLNIDDKDVKWILHFQTIIDITGAHGIMWVHQTIFSFAIKLF